MPSKRYAAPLRLEPLPSRQLAGLTIAAVVGASLLPFLFPLPWFVHSCVLVAAAGFAYQIHARHFGRQRIVRAVWDELNQWRVWFAYGSEHEVVLAGDSFVSPELMILNFVEEKRRFSLVILSDVLDHDTRRKLRVRLLLQRVRREAAPALAASGEESTR